MSWWPDVSESTIMKTADEIISFIQQSIALQKAVQALEAAAESGSTWDIAKAIFNLIKVCYSADILWKIIESLCSNMSTWEWIKTVGIVTAMIIADIATDGLALIAEIVLALNNAIDFIKKLTNLSELKTIRKSL